MSSVSNRETVGGVPKELQLLDWPLRQQPVRTLLLLALLLGASAYAARVLGQPWLGIAALVLLMLCAWRVWIPVRFELGPRGVTERTLGRTRRIPWRDIARCEIRRRGVLLAAEEDAPGLSPLRGIYIHLPRDAQRVHEVLEFYLGPRPRTVRKDDSASRPTSPATSSDTSLPKTDSV